MVVLSIIDAVILGAGLLAVYSSVVLFWLLCLNMGLLKCVIAIKMTN